MTATRNPATPAPRGPRDANNTVATAANAAARRGQPEQRHERVNRRWNEVLQETRVAQTGIQILFAFLLSVAFTERFEDLGTTDLAIYVTTVILAAATTGCLIAPVSLHRFLSGQSMKDEVVETAGRLMIGGLVLLALTVGSTLLLILRFVLPGLLAEILVGTVMLWFALAWYALPMWLRRRSDRANKTS